MAINQLMDVPSKMLGEGPTSIQTRHSSKECWNQADMDVSGCILADMDAGYPCRHDEEAGVRL
jgi:hypothetical protein